MDKQSRLSSDSRLILISNGEPYVHKYKNNKIALEKLAGGLTTGLDPLMKQEGGIWIAWGRGNADFKVLDKKNKIKVPDNNGYTLKRVKLDKTEVDGFYYGFSNETLWPISHSIISKANYNPEYWKIYQQVNQKYAESALEEVQDNDLVWIHDYHLTLLPKLIKKEKKKARIAFFWHIPWPPWE